jgi:Helicase conserved C-terminal domain
MVFLLYRKALPLLHSSGTFCLHAQARAHPMTTLLLALLHSVHQQLALLYCNWWPLLSPGCAVHNGEAHTVCVNRNTHCVQQPLVCGLASVLWRLAEPTLHAAAKQSGARMQEAPRVERFLLNKGWKAVAIHGDISQDARNKAVEQFSAGEVRMMVATDVAARGLDIPDVEVVINYSFPLTVEDYVHRIGRTGRAGKSGISHTLFVGKHDKAKAGELVNVLREAGQDVPKALTAFGTGVKKKESKLYGAHFKDVDLTAKATKVKFDSDDE